MAEWVRENIFITNLGNAAMVNATVGKSKIVITKVTTSSETYKGNYPLVATDLSKKVQDFVSITWRSVPNNSSAYLLQMQLSNKQGFNYSDVPSTSYKLCQIGVFAKQIDTETGSEGEEFLLMYAQPSAGTEDTITFDTDTEILMTYAIQINLYSEIGDKVEIATNMSSAGLATEKFVKDNLAVLQNYPNFTGEISLKQSSWLSTDCGGNVVNYHNQYLTPIAGSEITLYELANLDSLTFNIYLPKYDKYTFYILCTDTPLLSITDSSGAVAMQSVYSKVAPFTGMSRSILGFSGNINAGSCRVDIQGFGTFLTMYVVSGEILSPDFRLAIPAFELREKGGNLLNSTFTISETELDNEFKLLFPLYYNGDTYALQSSLNSLKRELIPKAFRYRGYAKDGKELSDYISDDDYGIWRIGSGFSPPDLPLNRVANENVLLFVYKATGNNSTYCKHELLYTTQHIALERSLGEEWSDWLQSVYTTPTPKSGNKLLTYLGNVLAETEISVDSVLRGDIVNNSANFNNLALAYPLRLESEELNNYISGGLSNGAYFDSRQYDSTWKSLTDNLSELKSQNVISDTKYPFWVRLNEGNLLLPDEFNNVTYYSDSSNEFRFRFVFILDVHSDMAIRDLISLFNGNLSVQRRGAYGIRIVAKLGVNGTSLITSDFIQNTGLMALAFEGSNSGGEITLTLQPLNRDFSINGESVVTSLQASQPIYIGSTKNDSIILDCNGTSTDVYSVYFSYGERYTEYSTESVISDMLAVLHNSADVATTAYVQDYVLNHVLNYLSEYERFIVDCVKETDILTLACGIYDIDKNTCTNLPGISTESTYITLIVSPILGHYTGGSETFPELVADKNLYLIANTPDSSLCEIWSCQVRYSQSTGWGYGMPWTKVISNEMFTLTDDGGFAAGQNASLTNNGSGGAIGNSAECSQNGFAGGAYAGASRGGAIGDGANTRNGGAVGSGAKSQDGFAGGANAKVGSDDIHADIDAIQLGTGLNTKEKTLQIYDYTMMEADGTIPKERLPEDVSISNIKKNPSDTTGDIIATHLTVGTRKNDSIIGTHSFAQGSTINASGSNSHAEGMNTTASGSNSHAEGFGVTASGDNSHAEGYNTTALDNQHVIGHFNNEGTDGKISGTTGDAFIIGNGSSGTTKSNAFRVAYNGSVYGMSTFNSTGADYAEYLEWEDGNTDGEDRRGLFVTWGEDGKIKIANSGGDDIIGIVSAMPSVIGNSYDDQWQGMYETDVFGQPISHIVHYDAVYEEIDVPDVDEDGNTLETTHKEQKLVHEAYDAEEYIINSEYDPEQEYVPRSQRKEWAVIGLFGQLVVIDDGTCVAGGYCTVGTDGVATKSENGFKVLKRLDDTHIRVYIGRG